MCAYEHVVYACVHMHICVSACMRVYVCALAYNCGGCGGYVGAGLLCVVCLFSFCFLSCVSFKIKLLII